MMKLPASQRIAISTIDRLISDSDDDFDIEIFEAYRAAVGRMNERPMRIGGSDIRRISDVAMIDLDRMHMIIVCEIDNALVLSGMHRSGDRMFMAFRDVYDRIRRTVDLKHAAIAA